MRLAGLLDRSVHLNTLCHTNSYPFYMLLETSGSDEEHDMAKMLQLLERAMEDGVVGDGAIAQDLAQGAHSIVLGLVIGVGIPITTIITTTRSLAQHATCGSCGS